MSEQNSNTGAGNPQNSTALTPTSAPAGGGSNGSTKAYQAVALSAALAVQDATDSLRNAATIATTAIGVAFSQMLATGDTNTYSAAIHTAQHVIKQATDDFKDIGHAAAHVLDRFSSEPSPSKSPSSPNSPSSSNSPT